MRLPGVMALVLAVLMAVAVTAVIWPAPAHPGALCGQMPAVQPAVRHIIVVMLENRSYGQVAGSPAAPCRTKLASACGSATGAFGVAHGSASNYLGASAGRYPSLSLHGCDYSACASRQNNIDQQLDGAGLSWKAYEESMPLACDKSGAWPCKIGHNPAVFYTGISSAECQADDVSVAGLTRQVRGVL